MWTTTRIFIYIYIFFHVDCFFSAGACVARFDRCARVGLYTSSNSFFSFLFRGRDKRPWPILLDDALPGAATMGTAFFFAD